MTGFMSMRFGPEPGNLVSTVRQQDIGITIFQNKGISHHPRKSAKYAMILVPSVFFRNASPFKI